MTAAIPDEWITSLGIDLGTSTTKMIVSRLKISRVSGVFSIPEFKIAERILAYSGEVYTTPLKNEDELDVERISVILKEEYGRAGLRLSDVKSGAVIITGETANKKNARQIVHELAERAGDFVVATAGADLEGVLAGKGAGAEARSLETCDTVVNVDVGGGTANAAFFRRGVCLRTATLRIGGRLIRLNREGGIEGIAPSFAPWLQSQGFILEAGQRISFAELRDITDRMAECLLSFIAGEAEEESVRLLLVGKAPGPLPAPGELMVSGGIAALMSKEAPQTVEQAAVFGDIGPLLAHAIERAAGRYSFKRVQARQTVRATVIGAGMQTMEISGATVYIHPGVLPVRNLPVVKLELSGTMLADARILGERMYEAMEIGKRLHASDASPPFALALSGIEYCSYTEVQRLADAISAGFNLHFPDSDAAVVICRNDMAKALGQALALRCGERPAIVCIDRISAGEGDYVDLGEPIAGSLVPVVVKTLVFQ